MSLILRMGLLALVLGCFLAQSSGVRAEPAAAQRANESQLAAPPGLVGYTLTSDDGKPIKFITILEAKDGCVTKFDWGLGWMFCWDGLFGEYSSVGPPWFVYLEFKELAYGLYEYEYSSLNPITGGRDFLDSGVAVATWP